MIRRLLHILRRRGGAMPAYRYPADSVPAMLSHGEVNPSPERLEQLGLTADARRAREGRSYLRP